MFNTYIDEQFMINRLLDHDWIVINKTWTNCPQDDYNNIKEISPDYYTLENDYDENV